MGEALSAETQGERRPQEGPHTREHLLAKTDVPVVADAATAESRNPFKTKRKGGVAGGKKKR